MGCQFLALNFTLNDAFINNYLKLENRFGKYSFMLKPRDLRYNPETINKPKEQNPNVSFATGSEATALGNIIY
jgi:hypothetical protein